MVKSTVHTIAEFDLSEVRLGRPLVAIVRGRDKDTGIELELKIPISLNTRADRRTDPTFPEIKSAAENSIARLCLKMAWALNKYNVISRVDSHHNQERLKAQRAAASLKNAPVTSSTVAPR